MTWRMTAAVLGVCACTLPTFALAALPPATQTPAQKEQTAQMIKCMAQLKKEAQDQQAAQQKSSTQAKKTPASPSGTLGTADKCTHERVQMDKGKIVTIQVERLPDSKKQCKVNQCDNLCKKDANGRWIGGTVTILPLVPGQPIITVSKCDPKFFATTAALTAGQTALNTAGDAIKDAANAIGNGDAIPQDVKDRLAAAGFDYKQIENVAAKINENPQKVDEMLQALASGDQDKAKAAAESIGLSEDQLSKLKDNMAQMTPEKIINALPPEMRDAAKQWLGLTNPSGSTFSTETPDTQPNEKKFNPTLQVPADPRYTVYGSAENAAVVACEFQTATFGRSCNAQSAAAVGASVIQMETGGNNSRCTGSYCGWGQLGPNETRWAMQTIQKWANSDISPESRQYAESLLDRANKIGGDYAGLNKDPVLGPALLMARLSDTRLSDRDPGVPVLTNIQGMTDDVRTQTKLAYLNQFMPNGWGNGQFYDWNRPLISSQINALGGYQRIHGAYTLNDALNIMDSMGKYVNPTNKGLSIYNDMLAARGDGTLAYGPPPAPGAFGGSFGSDIVQRRYGSPFAALNPFNSSVYSNNSYAPYAYSAPIAYPTQQVGYPSSAVQTSQPQQYPQTSPPVQVAQPVPPVVTPVAPTITPVATLIAPLRVSRGNIIVLSWSSIGMMRGIPCVLSETAPESTKLAEANGGEYRLKTATSSSAARYSFALTCRAASDASVITRTASVIIE